MSKLIIKDVEIVIERKGDVTTVTPKNIKLIGACEATLFNGETFTIKIPNVIIPTTEA